MYMLWRDPEEVVQAGNPLIQRFWIKVFQDSAAELLKTCCQLFNHLLLLPKGRYNQFSGLGTENLKLMLDFST